LVISDTKSFMQVTMWQIIIQKIRQPNMLFLRRWMNKMAASENLYGPNNFISKVSLFFDAVKWCKSNLKILYIHFWLHILYSHMLKWRRGIIKLEVLIIWSVLFFTISKEVCNTFRHVTSNINSFSETRILA